MSDAPTTTSDQLTSLEGFKNCSACGKLRPADAEFFVRNKHSPDGLHNECKTCRIERTKKSRKESDELVLAEIDAIRNRAIDNIPNELMAQYYAQRASAGLIITEGTYEQDAFQSRAYLSQPGITNDRHQAGWAKVCDAVHAHGAKIIVQLMHGGRVCDPRTLNGQPPVSASATQSGGWVLYTDSDDESRSATFRAIGPRSPFRPPVR
jgi:hypothetical protein